MIVGEQPVLAKMLPILTIRLSLSDFTTNAFCLVLLFLSDTDDSFAYILRNYVISKELQILSLLICQTIRNYLPRSSLTEEATNSSCADGQVTNIQIAVRVRPDLCQVPVLLNHSFFWTTL